MCACTWLGSEEPVEVSNPGVGVTVPRVTGGGARATLACSVSSCKIGGCSAPGVVVEDLCFLLGGPCSSLTTSAFRFVMVILELRTVFAVAWPLLMGGDRAAGDREAACAGLERGLVTAVRLLVEGEQD